MNTLAPKELGPTLQQIAAGFVVALDCATQFEGATAPNPAVGCTVLDIAGSVLAVTAHQKAGKSHAEALAIAQCRADGTFERIHTIIVTLEPCNHDGRTSPCTQAILTTPASKVWIGVPDPNADVKGGGAQTLRQAGLIVRFITELDHPQAAELVRASERLIAPFAKRMATTLPWVTIKQAIDGNGSMIPPAGAKTFTSEKSLVLAHNLRKRADAILTGSGTILADNPEFTVRRVPDFPDKKRLLIILDRRGRVPERYLAAARARGFDVFVEDVLRTALERVAAHGGLEVLVEAGPTLTEAVRASGLWDEHITITKNSDPLGEDNIDIAYRRDLATLAGRKDANVLGYH